MSLNLVVSPHPDDAPLSMGGTIHALAAAGERVLILTAMGGDAPENPPKTPLVRELHARWGVGTNPAAVRRGEDADAAAVLGAEIEFLDIPDCIYRTVDGDAIYRIGRDLFGGVAPDDPALAPIPPRLAELASAAVRVYAPLAAGNHVDHQIARGWVFALQDENPALEVLLYEDYPYAEDFLALMRAQNNGAISLERFELTEADLRAKMEAVARYASQISTFWDSLAEMEMRIHSHFTRGGTLPPHERFWNYTGYGDERGSGKSTGTRQRNDYGGAGGR